MFIKRSRTWSVKFSLRHTENSKYFSGLSLTRNQREAHMFDLAREVVGEREMTFCEGEQVLW